MFVMTAVDNFFKKNRIDPMACIINNDYSLWTEGWVFFLLFFENFLAYLMRINVEFHRKSQINNSKESN